MMNDIPNLATLTGRDKPLDILSQVFADSVEGKGRLVFITGEAGIGKTYFARCFLHWSKKQRKDLIISMASCTKHFGKPEAFLPFKELLSYIVKSAYQETQRNKIIGILQDVAGPWLSVIPGIGSLLAAIYETGRAGRKHFSGLPSSAFIKTEEMFSQYFVFLEKISQDRPLILFIDDLHWADPSSLDLINYLATRLYHLKVMVVCTLCSEETLTTKDGRDYPLASAFSNLIRNGTMTEIPLGRLSYAQLMALVDQVFPNNQFPSSFKTKLYSHTEGNPFFLIETLKLLEENGFILLSENEEWRLVHPISEFALPKTVEALLEERISRLLALRNILETASVEGINFSSRVLAQMLSLSQIEVEEILQHITEKHRLIELIEEQSWTKGNTLVYRFTHVLFHQAIYQRVTGIRRNMAHGQIGIILESEFSESLAEVAPKLVSHFEIAGDLRRAIAYCLFIVRDSSEKFLFSDVIRYSERGLLLLETSSTEAEPELNEATSDNWTKSLLLLHLAKAKEFSFKWNEAKKHLVDCLKVLPQARNSVNPIDCHDFELDVLGEIATTATMLGEFETAKYYLFKCLEKSRSSADISRATKTIMQLQIWHEKQGEWAEVLSYYHQIRERLFSVQDFFGIAKNSYIAADVYLYIGKFDKALEQAELSLSFSMRIITELQRNWRRLFSQVMLGDVCTWRCDYRRAEESYFQAISLSRETGTTVPMRYFWLLLLLQNKPNEAKNLLISDLENFRKGNDIYWVGNTLTNLGWLLAREGKWEAANNALKEALQIAKKHTHIYEAARTTVVIYKVAVLKKRMKALDIGNIDFIQLFSEAQKLCLSKRYSYFDQLAALYYTLANLAIDNQDIDQAIYAIQKSLSFAKKYNSQLEISIIESALRIELRQNLSKRMQQYHDFLERERETLRLASSPLIEELPSMKFILE